MERLARRFRSTIMQNWVIIMRNDKQKFRIRTAIDLETGKKREIKIPIKVAEKEIDALLKRDKDFLDIMAKL